MEMNKDMSIPSIKTISNIFMYFHITLIKEYYLELHISIIMKDLMII